MIHEVQSRAAYSLDEQQLDSLLACFSKNTSMTIRSAIDSLLAATGLHDELRMVSRNIGDFDSTDFEPDAI